MKGSVTTRVTALSAQVSCVDKAKYEVVRNSILKNLYAYGPLTHEQLGRLVETHLKFKLNDLAAWYYIMVEQDLEQHGEIRMSDPERQLIEVNL
ncbi:MAG: hypothetical protein IPJ46_05275 [Anaerolineales bacterium]|nr:hypothetical protein [Anaerolineales bacterium]